MNLGSWKRPNYPAGGTTPGEARGPGASQAFAGPERVPETLLQRLSFQLTLAMLSTSLIAIVPVAFFAFWATREVDAAAAAQERTLIERGVADRLEAVSREQYSVTVWDDAVVHASSVDRVWLDENLGQWLHEFYGHDMAVVLDPADRPVYMMNGGESWTGPAPEAELSVLTPLIARLRADLASGANERSDAAVTDVLTIAGRPSFVSLRPILPSSERVSLGPKDIRIHVAVRHLDGAFLTGLGRRFLVSEVVYVPDSSGAAPPHAVPISGAASGLLGHIVWSPSAPGSELIRHLAPGVLVSLVAMFGLSAFLLSKLRRAVTRVEVSEAHAQNLAFHDFLTGLPNRACFDYRMDTALAALEQDGGRLALHCIDLDRFKNVNDTLGHPAGDALIHQVAFRLTGLVRSGDTVARLGGDEFAVIQTKIRDVGDARRLAERILAAIREPFHLGEDIAFVDSSIGTVLAPDYGESRAELMRKADIALYEAKGSGKGRQCVFEAAQDDLVKRKRAIETDLRENLGRGAGLRVVYQPVFGIDGATWVGAEALVRWDHPVHGALSPAIFIPVAEERGLIGQLGAWVLREALLAAKAVDLPWIAVNVSAVQFRDPGFVDLVLDLLQELRFAPNRLQLEITEGLLLDATDAVASTLTKLRFAGICIALDDFGTGYSSLKYLHRYKVDKIKIDQSFVQNLGTADSTDAIVRAMIDLAAALDLGVTAEGVETPDQWRRLAGFGAPELQGYLLSQPVERAALAAPRPEAPRRSGAA